MASGIYLRDARHITKFIFTLSNAQFYEPLNVTYKPSAEYSDLIKPLLSNLQPPWMLTRDGFWFHAHPHPVSFPGQGWKIHISATLKNGAAILLRAAKIALAHAVPFKFALDRNVLSMMTSKMWPRGGSGKFITMYPQDLLGFKQVLEELYRELRFEEGPYVLSDKRYKDCRVLYYRYGGMERVTRTDYKGEKVLVLFSPTGEAVPDIRTPYFNLPPWVEDPFPANEASQQELTLQNGRYVITQALAFSNSGGVYLAEERGTGRKVVIKEARPHTLMDDRGNDAVVLLKREQELLELLLDTDVAPKPIESFYAWEHFFLVEEFLEGVDIREIMLTQSPLLRVNPSLEDGREFYETFRRLFRSFAQALHQLHRRGIVFGDLSANNLRVDPSTYAVRLIDFEGAFRPGIDQPTYLYTPGFKSTASIRKDAQAFEDDLYSLAATMLYLMFPIGALSSLRQDLFDTVLKTVLQDIGWSQTQVFDIITRFAGNEISCTQACELLDKPAPVQTPACNADVEADFTKTILRELGSFLLANMRDHADGSLFPADPFIHQTNPIGLGFGACGVLYALKTCGFEIPQHALEWLENYLDRAKPDDFPPGLLTGASGIAWTLWELGLTERATMLLRMANESSILKRHHSYFYGMAGVGMANLHFYLHTKEPEYLAMAHELAEFLLQSARVDDRGMHWESDNLIHLGLGYGQSGVALFFLRLFQLTGKEKWLFHGKKALEYDLVHGMEGEKGVLSFPRAPGDPTLQPYLEEGSAGIAKVAIRYGMLDKIGMILSDVHRKYSGFAGLLYGLGSFVDVLTDAFLFSRNDEYLRMAQRPISGMRDLYLIKQDQGCATPGDGLFRISCDYATGVAGVLRALHRYTYLEHSDFTLDEIGSVTDLAEQAAPVFQTRAALSAR
jgi:serine/threonine protein kinase